MKKNELLSQVPRKRENLLTLLTTLQDASPQNYLSEEDMELAARYLNVTKARVYGVVGYYSMLSSTPRGKHIIRLCRSPVCRMFGALDLSDMLEKELGVSVGGTTEDGLFTLEFSECLGRCTESPTMMVDESYYGSLDGKKIRTIIDRYRGGE